MFNYQLGPEISMKVAILNKNIFFGHGASLGGGVFDPEFKIPISGSIFSESAIVLLQKTCQSEVEHKNAILAMLATVLFFQKHFVRILGRKVTAAQCGKIFFLEEKYLPICNQIKYIFIIIC